MTRRAEAAGRPLSARAACTLRLGGSLVRVRARLPEPRTFADWFCLTAGRRLAGAHNLPGGARAVRPAGGRGGGLRRVPRAPGSPAGGPARGAAALPGRPGGGVGGGRGRALRQRARARGAAPAARPARALRPARRTLRAAAALHAEAHAGSWYEGRLAACRVQASACAAAAGVRIGARRGAGERGARGCPARRARGAVSAHQRDKSQRDKVLPWEAL